VNYQAHSHAVTYFAADSTFRKLDILLKFYYQYTCNVCTYIKTPHLIKKACKTKWSELFIISGTGADIWLKINFGLADNHHPRSSSFTCLCIVPSACYFCTFQKRSSFYFVSKLTKASVFIKMKDSNGYVNYIFNQSYPAQANSVLALCFLGILAK
jgi:hypothetical protein